MKKTVAFLLVLCMAFTLIFATSCDNQGACGHTGVKDVVVKEATCNAQGLSNTVCANCGKVIETKKISKLEHVYEAGFCKNDGCQSIDPDNNRFYANTLCSLDVDKTTVNNVGDVVVVVDGQEYRLTDLKILKGKSEGVVADDGTESGVKELLSADIQGFLNMSAKVVSDEGGIKVIILQEGIEFAAIRVDDSAIQSASNAFVGLLPDLGTSGGSSTQFDFAALIEAFKVADGTDATVKAVNTAIHNVIISVSDITATENGYVLTLDYDKVKAFNHTVATQTAKALCDNLFGDNFFDNYVSFIISMAINGDANLTPEEKALKITQITTDCNTSSLYDVIVKYGQLGDINLEEVVNNVVDLLNGTELSLNLDTNGNAVSARVKAENWTVIAGGADPSQTNFPDFTVNATIEIKFENERVKGDEYQKFDELGKIVDTDKAKGEYEAFSQNTDLFNVKCVIGENGNITSASYVLKVASSVNADEYVYYKVECNAPLAVLKQMSVENPIYSVYAFIESDYGVISGDVNVYYTDSTGTTKGDVVMGDELNSIVYLIGCVDFTFEALSE